MTAEHFADLVSGGIETLVPPDILQKLVVNCPDISQFPFEEDLAHNFPHILEVLSAIHHFYYDYTYIEPSQRIWATQTALYHDKGYKFVTAGLLSSEEHHFGSIYYAWKAGVDVEVLAAISMHVLDVLPPNTPAWVKLVRDADRLARVGYTGINNIISYLGFWGEQSWEEVRGLVDDRILADDYYPEAEEFQRPAMEFFDTRVLPWLYGAGVEKVNELMEIFTEVLRRVGGDTLYDLEPIMRQLERQEEGKLRHSGQIIQKLGRLRTLMVRDDKLGWEEFKEELSNKYFR